MDATKHPLPASLALAVAERSLMFDRERVGPRIWAKDHTVWKPEPTEIADRLSWLWAPERYLAEASDIRGFADEVARDSDHVVLLGMGGSSLAPEVMHGVKGPVAGRPRLVVVDATDPGQIRAVSAAIDPRRTLFIVSSKSGTTIETLSQYAYFRGVVDDGGRFAAITDPGSSLVSLAASSGFRRVFLNDPDIGGRFSALSFFGLVPGAVAGLNIERLLESAQDMAVQCGPAVTADGNPGAILGIILGEAALAGRDKVTLVLPPHLASFGWWVEQLIAESSGKDDVGIVPIEGEALADPAVYGNDRVFIAYGDHDGLDALEASGHPVIRYPAFDSVTLGAEFWRWEYATTVACWVLGVNPFDQPNVQEAKDATAIVLEGGSAASPTPSAAAVLGEVAEGDYIAINAFVARNAETQDLLQQVRTRLRDRYHVATVTGFGPRFLHSTGQLHKGGANNGVFLQVVDGHGDDLPIPGQSFSFGQLIRAQADGDLASLQTRGRRVARLTTEQLSELR